MNRNHSSNATSSSKRGVGIVPQGETPCVWMEAGVLTCWICDRDLSCETCPLDAALRHVLRHAGPAPLRCRPRGTPDVRAAGGPKREAGPPKLAELVDAELPPLDRRARYTRTHVWVRTDVDSCARIGLDPLAARVLGRLRFVVPAAVGSRILRGQPCAWLNQEGGMLTLRSPLSGTVLERNEAMCERTEFVLHDPLGADWLLRLRPLRLHTESQAWMTRDDFEPLLRRDFALWRRTMRQAMSTGASGVGRTLHDGGHHVRDLNELVGSTRAHRLAAKLLGCPL